MASELIHFLNNLGIEIICLCIFSSKFNQSRAFNKAVSLGEKSKIVNIGTTFILAYRVARAITEGAHHYYQA